MKNLFFVTILSLVFPALSVESFNDFLGIIIGKI